MSKASRTKLKWLVRDIKGTRLMNAPPIQQYCGGSSSSCSL
uniref:Uncharacterized protein n=1 Tax=Arundo donax TaxID=35708 RepID=A0A0A9FUF9_ARUDO